jgi:hypothetical protein
MTLSENNKLRILKISWSILLFGVICDFNIVKEIQFLAFKLNLQSSTISVILYFICFLAIVDLKTIKINFFNRKEKDILIFSSLILAVAIISSILSTEKIYALNITLFRLVLYYICLLITIFQTNQFPKSISFLIKSIIVAAGLNSIAAILDFFVPSFNLFLVNNFQHLSLNAQYFYLNDIKVIRPSGFISDPNLSGYFTGLAALILFINNKKIKSKFIKYLYYITSGFAFGLIASKSAYIVIILSVIAIFFIKKSNWKPTLIFVILFYLLPLISPYNIINLRSTTEKSNIKYEISMGRGLIWKASLKCLESSPVIGIGTGVFFKTSRKVMADVLEKDDPEIKQEFIENLKKQDGINPHNLFIAVAVEYGIIGLIILVSFIIKTITGLIRSKYYISLIIFGGLISVSVISNYAPYFKLYFIICIFLYSAFKRDTMIINDEK